MKQQLLESFGFGPQERFPVYADRFPIQLLSYLRLSRIQDPGLFAKVGTAWHQLPCSCTSEEVHSHPAAAQRLPLHTRWASFC